MPLPPSLTVKTLHGRYSALPDGSAPTGTVDFIAPAVLRVTADDTIVLPTVYTANVIAGEFTVNLPASDDPAISPTGWTYEVAERLVGHPTRRYRVPVPLSATGTLELSDLQPATTVVPAASYATTADTVALDARVDALEAGGGGGGGGGVTDHGALTGLADDDHGQYYNQARGDARYVRPAQLATVATTGAYTDLTGRPSIPDSADDVGAAPVAHNHVAANVTDFSTAVDARIALVIDAAPSSLDTLNELAAALNDDPNFAGTITTLIGTKQPLNAVLTQLAAVAAADNDVIQRKAGALTNRTPAQLKADLSLTKGDVGLSAVDNTSDAGKPVSTAQQTALDGKQDADADLTAVAALTPVNDDLLQRKSGAWTNRTPAQVKTDLSLTKGDVGLSNVDDTSDAGKPVSTAAQTALDAKAPLASPTFTGTVTAPRTINTPVALTDAATIATNAALGNHFRATLGGNRTLGNPTNPVDGQRVIWELIQDATGNRTITLGSAFALGTDISAVTLSTGASKRDFLGAVYSATAAAWHVLAFARGY